jgi:hypothetical protein
MSCYHYPMLCVVAAGSTLAPFGQELSDQPRLNVVNQNMLWTDTST